jgi:hypothetical protein
MSEKRWYKYTDESGTCWRIQTNPDLAEIGGLQPTDAHEFRPLPKNIKPRYIWLQEWPRPVDRLAARQKVILERDRLKYFVEQRPAWQLSGKELKYRSYYGEVVEADAL